MKWMLILYFVALGGEARVATSIGPFDEQPGCAAVGQLAMKNGWKAECYPVGSVPLKKPPGPAPKKDDQKD
jgi:hypothetical protein